MSTTFIVNTTLATETCIKCGVLFALPLTWQAEFMNTHQQFYCPAGHSQYYPQKSDAEKLRDEVARLQTNIEHKEATVSHLREQNSKLERSRAALRGVHTRTCNRVKNGVCPCCNRSFGDLSRHMATKHPDFHAAEPEAVK